MPLTMFDAVSIEHIPSEATIVAGYVNGWWPTYKDVVARFPHAHHVSIAVTAGVAADVLDVERGDATPAQAPAWIRQMRALGRKPIVYCSVSLWSTVQGECAKADVPEPLWWAAHYTGKPHLESGSVATQWADGTPEFPGLALYTDTSMVSPNFPGLTLPSPDLAHMAAAKLVVLPNAEQAALAAKNGWPIYKWNGHAFVAHTSPDAIGVREYAIFYYEYKRP